MASPSCPPVLGGRFPYVLLAKVLKEYLSAKMNLDSYNGLTDPREHIQNMKGSLELVT
jgi:hypothetical protein